MRIGVIYATLRPQRNNSKESGNRWTAKTVGGIILGGLQGKFKPFILGMQGSNQDSRFCQKFVAARKRKGYSSTSLKYSALAFYGKSRKFPQKPKNEDQENQGAITVTNMVWPLWQRLYEV